MILTFRPIKVWPADWNRTHLDREASPFTATYCPSCWRCPVGEQAGGIVVGAEALTIAEAWKHEAGREGVLAREVLRLHKVIDEILPDVARGGRRA